jgi:tight adherence protein C
MFSTPVGISLLVVIALLAILFMLSSRSKFAHRIERLKQLDDYATIKRVADDAGEERERFRIVRAAAEILVTPRSRLRIHNILAKAGRFQFEDIESTSDKKVVYGFIGGGLGLLLALSGSAVWLVSIPLLFAMGFFLPDVLLYNEGIKRAQEIEKSLADSVDLLSMCVESGLSLEAAMLRVAKTQKSAVAQEFGAALSELQMGKSRNEALEDMSRRNNNPDLRRFVTGLQQVDRLGVPISSVLSEQSHEMRLIRQQHARENAQKVPIKILMPVMLCFLPGIFIIILGPAVVSIIKGLAFAN